VAAVDLDVREQPAGETYARARAAAVAVSQWAGTRVFAKIDSTLRGELGAFIGGVLVGSGMRGALAAPAFPEQGRLLVGGRLLLEGRLAEAGAPGLPDRLAASGLRAAAVQPAIACSGGERLRQEVQRLLDTGANAIVVDADTPSCLEHVAKVWWRVADSLLLAGSAGIARRVASLPEWGRMRDAGTRRRGDRGTGDGETRGRGDAGSGRGEDPGYHYSANVLVVAGTPAAATLRQLEELVRLREARILDISPNRPISGALPAPNGGVLVLRAAPAEPAGTSLRDHGECAEAVADACAVLARTYRPGGVVLTGGATARLVCVRLGVRAVRLTGELAPGVPRGVLVGGVWDGTEVVTKAGGFGGPSLLIDAIRWLSGSKEEST
jgi:D-threonate/D-erythronate kinase